MTTFAERLEDAMGVDWTPTTLGQKLDISNKRIDDWLRGRNRPGKKYVDPIADFLGIEPARLRHELALEKADERAAREARKRERLAAELGA